MRAVALLRRLADLAPATKFYGFFCCRFRRRTPGPPPLVDELDPTVARTGHKKQLASFCKIKKHRFALFR
jgi:hypothetical protein